MSAKLDINKAKAIVNEYVSNGYKKGKTLEKMGYSKSMQNVQPGRVINNALQRVVDENKELMLNSSNPRRDILKLVGLEQRDVIDEYMFIVNQNKDLTNKLKALVPLLKELGIVWDDKAVQVAPTLNLTVKERDIIPLNQAIESTSHISNSTTLINIDSSSDSTAQPQQIEENTAQPSHISEGGKSGSASEEVKEGESPLSKIVENSIIDNTINISSNE